MNKDVRSTRRLGNRALDPAAVPSNFLMKRTIADELL